MSKRSRELFTPVFLVALLLMVGFGVWCVSLVLTVREQRKQLETRVGWLSMIQRCQSELEETHSEPPKSLTNCIREISLASEMYPTLPEELAKPLEDQLGAALQKISSENKEALLRTLGKAIAQIRKQTGAISASLGKEWDQLNVLVLLSLLLAVTNLLLLMFAQRSNGRLQDTSQRLEQELKARLQSEAALVAVEDRVLLLEHATGELGVGIALFDESGSLTYTGPALRTVLSEWKDTARFWEEIRPHIPKAQPCEICNEPTRKGRAEARLQPPTGESRMFALLFSGHGHEIGHERENILLVQDVSELEKLRAQLQQSERLSSLGMLAAGLAHELNNPLAYILLNLTHMEKSLYSLLSNPKQQESIDTMEELAESIEGAKRLQQIIGDVKLFARPQEQNPTSISISRVLEAAFNVAAPQLRKRAIPERKLAPDLPFVMANESRLGQVFLDLLLNAVRTIPEGQQSRHRVTLRAFVEESNVIIEVSDTGEGIDPNHLPHIFDPFFTTKAANIGAGLNLAISHRWIASLGGELTVKSVPNQGTTFRVALPSSAPAEDTSKRSETPAQLVGGARILVVDDERPILTSLQKALSEHSLTLASGVSEALKILGDGESFDLILCDLNMPERNGEELFHSLLERRPEYQNKFIFMSGGGFTPREKFFVAYLEANSIEKPFDIEQLRQKITNARRRTEIVS
jgi:C4-dicarboxylate-specific signal transduction histidine kinase